MPNEVKAKVLFVFDAPETKHFQISTFVVDVGLDSYPWIGFKKRGHPGVLYKDELPLPEAHSPRDFRTRNIMVDIDLDAQTPLSAVFLGNTFQEQAVKFELPVNIPADHHIFETGLLWFEPRDAAWARRDAWIQAAAHRIFVERCTAQAEIANLMEWADLRAPETLAAYWYTRETGLDKRESLEGQQAFGLTPKADIGDVALAHWATIAKIRAAHT